MNSGPLKIWCNAHFPEAAMDLLHRRTKNHHLIFPIGVQKSNLVGGDPDPLLDEADIAFGQPEPQQAIGLARLRWVHLTSAGYTRYDRDDLRTAFRQRGAIMTNSSSVYAEPCAEHIFAMMLATARQLPQCVTDQLKDQPWHPAEHRIRCRLLLGQTVLILGYGTIAARLVEMLEPFRMQITATRRRPTKAPGCTILSTERTDEMLPLADHVVNILPANSSTQGFVSRHRLALLKPTAILYNVGRGATVDQDALLETLKNQRIAGAYLDVTDPEPLPATHPLWLAPNCFITPHTAGGHEDEFERLVTHFADNLDRFQAAEELQDRIA